jgi:hypothetical protein
LYCVYVFSINSLSILYNVVHAPRGNQLILCVCVDVMYSGEYDVCDVTLSVHPHRESTLRIEPTVVRQTFQLARCGCTLRVTSQTSIS